MNSAFGVEHGDINKGLSSTGAKALGRVASGGGKDRLYAESRLAARAGAKSPEYRGKAAGKAGMKRSLMGSRKGTGSLRSI
jgi:hypothetical protein